MLLMKRKQIFLLFIYRCLIFLIPGKNLGNFHKKIRRRNIFSNNHKNFTNNTIDNNKLWLICFIKFLSFRIYQKKILIHRNIAWNNENLIKPYENARHIIYEGTTSHPDHSRSFVCASRTCVWAYLFCLYALGFTDSINNI